MKVPLLFCCLATGLALAQEPDKIDFEARRESVATLKQHLDMREKRLAELTAEIRERGSATDKKIGELVDMLAGLKDSQSSKRRISQIKAEAIGSLKKMLAVYSDERRQIAQKLLGNESVPSEALKKDMETIDALTEKRVAQIVELVKSMPGKVTEFLGFSETGGRQGQPIIDSKGRLITENVIMMPKFATFTTPVYAAIQPDGSCTFEISHPKRGTSVTLSIADASSLKQ